MSAHAKVKSTPQPDVARVEKRTRTESVLPAVRQPAHIGLVATHQLAADQLSSNDLQWLQRSVGNQMVQRMLASRAPTTLQPKLETGPVDDRYERDADTVAHNLAGSAGMATMMPHVTSPLQRMAQDGGEIVTPELEASIHAAKGSGNKLGRQLQRQMEDGFGTDFSGVHVHTDQRADQLNRTLNARAFTTGKDIFFKKDQYQPGRAEGRQLLAHELTHVVQQNGAQRIQRWPWSKKNKKNTQVDDTQSVDENSNETPVNEPTINAPTQEEPFVYGRRPRLPTVDQGGLEQMLNGFRQEPENQLVNGSVSQNTEQSEEEPQKRTRKSNKAPYHKLLGKLLKGSKKETNVDKLEQAHQSAGSIAYGTPDYVNPNFDGEADQLTVTVAVAQEQSDWWESLKKLKKTGIRKLFQSPIKFIKSVIRDEGEQYLFKKVLKQQGKLPTSPIPAVDAINKAVQAFHQVGHTWVRFTKRAGGKIQELYSYGFWPRKILNSGGWNMMKYVPGQVRHPDTIHEKDEQKKYFDTDVAPDKFNDALSLAQSHYESPPNYHLLDYNCTKFAREVLKKAGGSFPSKGVFPGFAFSPGELFKEIGELQKDPSLLESNQRVRDLDSPEDFETVKQTRREQNDRVRGVFNLHNKLTPKSPTDYAQGIYDHPLAAFAKVKGAKEVGEKADEEIEISGIDKENDLLVKDNWTSKYGRGLLTYKGTDSKGDLSETTRYVDLDAVITPGAKPSHDMQGNPIIEDQPQQNPQDPGALPERMLMPAVIQLMKMGEWDSLLDNTGVGNSELNDLNDQQVANLAQMINMTPYRLMCKIAELNGKPAPPFPDLPSREGRPQLAPVGPDVPSRRNRPQLSQPEEKTPSQNTVTKPNVSNLPQQGGASLEKLLEELEKPLKDPPTFSTSVAPQLLGSARGQWGRTEVTPTEDEHSQQEEIDFDDPEDSEGEYIEIPDQIAQDSILAMMKFDDWDTIFEIMGLSRSLFKDLSEDQVAVIAEAIGKTPEALQATINNL